MQNYLTAIIAKLAGSPEASVRWDVRPQCGDRPDRFGQPRGGVGQGPRRQPGEDRGDIQAGRVDRPRSRRTAGGRRGDLLGRDALLADPWSTSSSGSRRARHGRVPGRHGPHAPLHPGRERPRGSHPPRRLRLERPYNPRRRAQDLDCLPSSLDDRLPCRPERRDRLRLRDASTTPAATAWRPTPTASFDIPITPDSGSATRAESLRKRAVISAGTAACSPTRS